MKLLTLIAMLLFPAFAWTAVSFPPIIDSNMVLQRQSTVVLWGTATPQAQVIITTSWNQQTYTATAAADGRFRVEVTTTEAGGPYTITFDDGQRTELDNVMLGEVWLCMGQSNMEEPMDGFDHDSQIIIGGPEAIAAANPQVPIRMFTHERQNPGSGTVYDEYRNKGKWEQNTPEAVTKTSATAYFFARYLQEQLQVPVGIVISAWSGANIRPFMSREATKDAIDQGVGIGYDCGIYNGMIATLRPLRFRGLIWYQGEANIDAGFKKNEEQPEWYRIMFKSFLSDLRQKFQNGQFPCYYAEMAPFNYKSEGVAPAFREMQAELQDEIERVGMVSTVDVGDSGIHPPLKEVIGRRMALWALNRDYGRTEVVCESPVFDRWEPVGPGKARVWVKNIQGGPLHTNGYYAQGFLLQDDEGNWHSASGSVDGERGTIEVRSDALCNSQPQAVRYCFEDFQNGNVYSGAGLPLIPFRSNR